MKYVKIFTNPYATALTLIALLALLCLMATSELTKTVVITKFIGLSLVFIFLRLNKVWGRKGKLKEIKQLFGDPEEMQESGNNGLG